MLKPVKKIGIDCRSMSIGGGVKTYLTNLINELGKFDKKNKYFLYYDSEKNLDTFKFKNFKEIVLKNRYKFLIPYWEQIRLKNRVIKDEIDITTLASKDMHLLDTTGEKQVTIEELNSKWPEVVVGVKSFNHNLYAFIAASRIKEVKSNVIALEVAYKFHKQKIESSKSKKVLKEIFIKEFGADLKIECEVNPALIKSRGQNNGLSEVSNEDLVEEIFSDI